MAKQVKHERVIAMGVKLDTLELEVLRLLAEDSTSKEIAHRLNYSLGYINRILTRTYDKIGVERRVEAALWYQKYKECIGANERGKETKLKISPFDIRIGDFVYHSPRMITNMYMNLIEIYASNKPVSLTCFGRVPLRGAELNQTERNQEIARLVRQWRLMTSND